MKEEFEIAQVSKLDFKYFNVVSCCFKREVNVESYRRYSIPLTLR